MKFTTVNGTYLFDWPLERSEGFLRFRGLLITFMNVGVLNSLINDKILRYFAVTKEKHIKNCIIVTFLLEYLSRILFFSQN